MRHDFEIVGSFNNQRVAGFDTERTINLFEYIDPKGKKPRIMISTSGINRIIDETEVAGNHGVRQQFVFKDKMYAVIGAAVFQVDSSLTATLLFSFGSTTSGYVGITANVFQVIFVDGIEGWIWDTNVNAAYKITDEDFPAAPIDVAYLDGFFIVPNGGTPTFSLSQINQGLIWGGGDNAIAFTRAGNNLTVTGNGANLQTTTPFKVTGGSLPPPLVALTTYYAINIDANTIQVASSAANAKLGTFIPLTGAGTGTIENGGKDNEANITTQPGNIVACKVFRRKLFLFSNNYTEVWENAGAADFPIRPNRSLIIFMGTPSRGCVAVGFNALIFLGQDENGLGSVLMTTGTETVTISPSSLDYQLQQYAVVSDAFSIIYRENGIVFYRLNFTDADHTFVYNVTLSTSDNPMWHEEQMLDESRSVIQSHAYYLGKNFVGNYLKPYIYDLDDSYVTNDGEAIKRTRIARIFSSPNYENIRIDRFQIDLLQGQASESFSDVITADFSTNVINVPNGSHYPTGTNVYFTNVGGNLPQPLALDQSYYTINHGDDGLTLSFTYNGAFLNIPIILGDNGTGVTTMHTVANNENPIVYLSMSKDGGTTYGNRLTATMGKVGQTLFRTIWYKLGHTREFTVKIELYNELKFVVLGASWDFEVEPE